MIYLLLGTNMGDRDSNIVNARRLLTERLNVVLQESPVIETQAIGFDGEDFLNQVVVFDKNITPIELLDICQGIEIDMGREEHIAEYDNCGNRVYSSRIIDIDILLIDSVVLESERLTIPHPQVETRPFVKELLNYLKYDTRRVI